MPGLVVFDAERGEGQAAGTDALLASADEHGGDAQALQRAHGGQLREDAWQAQTICVAAINLIDEADHRGDRRQLSVSHAAS